MFLVTVPWIPSCAGAGPSIGRIESWPVGGEPVVTLGEFVKCTLSIYTPSGQVLRYGEPGVWRWARVLSDGSLYPCNEDQARAFAVRAGVADEA